MVNVMKSLDLGLWSTVLLVGEIVMQCMHGFLLNCVAFKTRRISLPQR